MSELIAETIFQAITADGKRLNVIARVGKPFPHSDGHWACPAELIGIDGRLSDVGGVDSMQAAALAIALLHQRLRDFLQQGGKLIQFDENVDVAQLAVIFGSNPPN